MKWSRAAVDAAAKSGLVAERMSEPDFAVALAQVVALAVVITIPRAARLDDSGNWDAILIDAHLSKKKKIRAILCHFDGFKLPCWYHILPRWERALGRRPEAQDPHWPSGSGSSCGPRWQTKATGWQNLLHRISVASWSRESSGVTRNWCFYKKYQNNLLNGHGRNRKKINVLVEALDKGLVRFDVIARPVAASVELVALIIRTLSKWSPKQSALVGLALTIAVIAVRLKSREKWINRLVKKLFNCRLLYLDRKRGRPFWTNCEDKIPWRRRSTRADRTPSVQIGTWRRRSSSGKSEDHKN